MWKKIRGKRPAAAGSSSSDSKLLTDGLTASGSRPETQDSVSSLVLSDRVKTLSTRTPTEVTSISTFDAPGVITTKTRDRSRDRRNDPMGINVVYEPKGVPLVDIILVHGLGGTSRATWSKNRDPAMFWPQEWLPMEPDIQLARIISFGYNAHFAAAGPAPISDISDFAKDLLYGMKFSKTEDAEDLDIGKRPIIFVVHSMGGLIVKKAYILGQNDSDYRDIVSSIRVIMFLATPHRGTKLAELLNRILTVSIFNHSPRQYISELNKGSSTLEDLNEQFRHVAPKMQIFSFYETLPTVVGPKKIMVLEKDSSILGYPGEISKSMDADHHDVCKYASQKDPNYITIRNALKDVVTGLKKAGQKLLDTVFAADTKKIENLLSVPTTRPMEDLLTLQKRRTPGTCGWILSAPKFVEWYETSETSGILWLYALPASGKSILSSFIVDSLTEDRVPCEYFFFQFGDQAKRSLSSCLRSLALQTAEHLPPFREALNSLSDSGFRLEKSDARTIWQRLFVSVLFKISSYTTIYWVIDALDESDHPQLAAEILTSISASLTPIKIAMISRQSPELTMTFERFVATSKVPFASISAAENERDIRTYVEKEMEFMHASPELKTQIVDKVLTKAGGNFLWVRLALEETLQCFTQEDIEDALESIPIGMESLYQRMETTITANARPSHKKLARFIFNWACCSRRPLTLEEIAQAIAPLSVFDLTRTIPQVCGQFVVVNGSNCLVMVHETAREYLTRSSNPDLTINPNVVHEQLFTRCIAFLEEENSRKRPANAESRPFLEYAATSWSYHLYLSSANSADLLTRLVLFLKGPAILTWIYCLANFGQLRVLIQTSQILSQFVRKKKKLDEGTSPLLHRLTDLDDVESWATDLVKIVGKFGANLSTDSTSIFKLVPPFCPKESMIFRQFGKTDSTTSAISVDGLTNTYWDDSLAKISIGSDIQAEKILSAGRFFGIQTSDGKIILYNDTTFEEAHTLNHEETILISAFSQSGAYLVSYGFRSAKVWDVAVGKLVHQVSNTSRSRALAISFANNERSIMIGTDDKTVQIADLSNTKAGWRVLDPRVLKEEIPIANSPNWVSFSPDASQVAISYRRFPLTVWSIDPPEVIGRCKRGASSSAWTVVDRVAWHPHSGDLVGIYTDGHIFKWNPSTGFYQEITTTNASEISCSSEGSLFVTGDGAGNIKLYNFQHFSAIYQLSSETPVNDVTFSSDSKRLYDVRGEHCNIWEPNALVRLNELDDRASESASVGDSRTSSSISEVWADLRDPITAVGIPTHGDIYLAGNDGGVVNLYSQIDGTMSQIWHNSNFMSIEHLDLSKDGSHFACADLGGTITVKSISIKLPKKDKDVWITKSVMDVKTEVEVGGIKQLLLSPDSSSLLVVSSTSATLYNTAEKAITSTLAYDSTPTKWTTHPTRDEFVLRFTASAISIYKWIDLSEVTTLQYGEPLPEQHTNQRHNSLFDALEPKLEILVAQTGLHILIRLTNPVPLSSRVVLISTNLIDSSLPPSSTISPLSVPPAIASQIYIPLGVLSSSRLIFIDHSHWICSWWIGDVRSPGARNDSSIDTVRKYFFLPKDWLSLDCLELCRVLADGKMICPNKGEVAVIKSGLECAW